MTGYVLGIALERDFTGTAAVALDGGLTPLPSIPRSAYTVRDSTRARRTHRREALADALDSLDQLPLLAVVSLGKSKGSADLLADAEAVLTAAGVPVAVVPRSLVIQFGTGSARAGSYQLLGPVVKSWDQPWRDMGAPDHGCGVQAVAACLGVAALGGVQPIPSSPGRDRALASVTWPTPLPLISEPR